MASESGRTALTIAVVAALSATGAWAVTLGESEWEPPRDEPPQPSLQTRVIFEETESRRQTATVAIGDGAVRFNAMQVDLVNVTFVTVVLHVQVEGVAARDSFELLVEKPGGDTKSAQHTGALNTAGYQHSVPVISWPLAAKPRDVVYENRTDLDAALAWSAANHTDRQASGLWNAQVSVLPPEVPGRAGNVSLSFVFTHYHAVALREDPRPAPAPEEAEDAPDDRTGDGQGRTQKLLHAERTGPRR